MKQRLIILLALLLILIAAAFMVLDFYSGSSETENIYEYDLSEYQTVDEDLLRYAESGAIETGMETIKALAIDDKDRVYVGGKGQIKIFDRRGEEVQSFFPETEIACIAVNPDGEIYVGARNHVEVYDFSGNQIARWDNYKDRSLISSIAVIENRVYVADAGSKVVLEYSRSGDFVREIGRRNKEKGVVGFVIPSPYFDLLIGREGELWVVNPGMHTLQSYNNNGEPVSSWKRTSMQVDGFSGCCNPSHIAMLSNGFFVTSEKGIERVKVHRPSGDLDCVVAGPDAFETGTVGLDLAVDSKDRVFVLDPKMKKIRIFEPIE